MPDPILLARRGDTECAMLQYVGGNARQFTTDYGNVSAASIGAIQRDQKHAG